MTRYALLLRGVNVGTKNSLPMAELRSMLEDIGCKDVKTYVQSGNAVFDTKLAEPKLTKAIEAALARYMGRPIATTLRTEAELAAVVDQNPLSELTTDPARLCVTFLSHAPTKTELAPLRAKDFAPERFDVKGREIYTWHPNGQGRSALAAALAKLPLRGAVTTRNWNTVQKLLAMLAVVSFAIGCSSSSPGHTQADCDKIATDIRNAAAQRGIPADGVCSSTNPTIQKDFAQACQSLKDCNADCCK